MKIRHIIPSEARTDLTSALGDFRSSVFLAVDLLFCRLLIPVYYRYTKSSFPCKLVVHWPPQNSHPIKISFTEPATTSRKMAIAAWLKTGSCKRIAAAEDPVEDVEAESSPTTTKKPKFQEKWLTLIRQTDTM